MEYFGIRLPGAGFSGRMVFYQLGNDG